MPRKKPTKTPPDVEQTTDAATERTTDETAQPAMSFKTDEPAQDDASEPMPTSSADATETTEQTAEEAAPWPPLGLDNTMRCPLAKTCASCRSTSERTILTVDSEAGGVLCMTLCGDCVEDESLTLPSYAWPTALRRIAQHAGHIGMDVDEMHAAMLAEREDGTAAETDDATDDQADAEPLSESA